MCNHLCILAMSIPNQLTSAKYTSFRYFDFFKFILCLITAMEQIMIIYYMFKAITAMEHVISIWPFNFTIFLLDRSSP